MNAIGRKITTSDSVVAITGERHLARALDRRLERRAVLLLDVAEDVLEHDDRVVDDDADGERDAEQRHVVQREVHRPHQREVAMIDAGIASAEMITARMLRMKNITTSAAKQAAPDQVLLERRDRGVDELRVVAGRRSASTDLRQRLLDRRRASRLTPSITATVFSPDGAADVELHRRRRRRARPRWSAARSSPRRSRCRRRGSACRSSVATTMLLKSSVASMRPSVRSSSCPLALLDACRRGSRRSRLTMASRTCVDRQAVGVQLLDVDDDVDLARRGRRRCVTCADAVDRLDARA